MDDPGSESTSSATDPSGAVAVVTGGASGIGMALAERLAGAGAKVAVVDLAAEQAEQLADRLRSAGTAAIGIRADVGDEAQVAAMVARVEDELGPIDWYCSNAGVGTGLGLGDLQAWDAGWSVHVLAHVHAARHVLPSMQARGSGVMVITASAAGLLMMMQSAPYTVTKHASVALAEWLSVNHGGSGIQFHCLCPQGVRTPMVSSDPRGESEVAASGRIIEPAEVADAVLEAVAANRFLVLPHPEVEGYEQAKVAGRDRWLAGMRKLRARLEAR